MMTLSEIVTHAEHLEPLPPTAARLAQVIADEKSTIDDAAEIVKYDQALSVEILKIANSTFSASNRNISSVREAIVRLGSGRILEMVISRRVRGPMKQPLTHYGYDEDELWRHSVASALAAEVMNRFITANISGIAFTAALLHDIGKLVMARVFPEEAMRNVWQTMQQEQVAWAAAEQKVFGFSHADVGAHIAKIWNLPEPIASAIRNHHSIDTDLSPVTDSVRVANIVARAIGQGVGYEGMGVAVDSGRNFPETQRCSGVV